MFLYQYIAQPFNLYMFSPPVMHITGLTGQNKNKFDLHDSIHQTKLDTWC